MKKALNCILALALLLSGTATFAESASVLPYEGDEITITMLGWQSYSDYDWDNMFGQWLKGKLGNIKIEAEIPADDTDTLINLYMSSGDIPDIMMYRDPDDFARNYADTGIALNLLDYAEYMPEYMARREQFPHLSRYDRGGATYMFFTCTYDGISQSWYANQDLLDKYNLAIPATYEEMMECCEVVCPQEEGIYGILPIYSWGLGEIYATFSAIFGLKGATPDNVRYNYDTGEWEFMLAAYSEEFKEVTQAIADAYAKGYLASDMLTWDDAMRDEAYYSGSWLFTRPYATDANRMAQGGLNITYMDPPIHGDTIPFINTDFRSDQTGWIYFVNANTEHPEICCAILELISSVEYAQHYYWGEEGITYTVDADGKRAYTEEYLNADDETKKKKYGIARIIPYFTDPFCSTYVIGDALCAANEDVINTANTVAAEKLVSGEYETYTPALEPLFDDYTQEDIDLIRTAVTTYVNENITAFILGTRDIAEWDAFVDGVAEYGDMNWVVEQYNAAEPRPLPPAAADRAWITP